MNAFRNILVVYDDSVGGDDALGQAVELARGSGARMTIATVLREEQLAREAREETRKRLRRLAESVRHDGIDDVSVVLLAGTPYFQVIRQSIADDNDLVVVSAASGKSLREKFFGSTATQLMRKCPCPVWVVKPGQRVPYSRIMAAVDPFAVNGSAGVASRILDLATALSARDDAVLSVVHAWEVDGSDLETIRSETTEPLRRDILGRHRQKRETGVNRLLAGYRMSEIAHNVHLPRESAPQAIRRIADEEAIDLIVMGTDGQRGLRPFLAGNTAEMVLASVKCGVLTVKPDGFVSPVAVSDHPFECVAEVELAAGGRRVA